MGLKDFKGSGRTGGKHTENGLGRHEELAAKGVVEVCCALPSKLQVLALIFTYWDVCRSGDESEMGTTWRGRDVLTGGPRYLPLGGQDRRTSRA
jgi:hypothetical protein